MLSRRFLLQTAAASVGLARASHQQMDVAIASATRDETPRVSVVLSSFAGSSDHDGTRIEGLRDPQPITKDLSDAQVDAMVRKALDLDNSHKGGLRAIAGAEEWIVIKPDITACYGLAPETKDGGAHHQYIPGAATDLRVVRSIIAYLVEHRCGARITVAEGSGEWLPRERSKLGVDGWTTDWGGAFGGLSYRKMMADFAKQHAGVQFDVADLNFDEAAPSEAPANPSHTYYVPATIQRCDKLISVAPLRTHRKAAVSLSILNYLGIAPGAFYGFPKKKLNEIGSVDEVAVDLFSFHPADYAVVGGSWGIEGDGPSHPGGRSVHHNVVIAGARAVAVDAVSAAIMGFDPSGIRHLQIAERKGFGGWDTCAVWTRGNDIESARRPFLKPSMSRGAPMKSFALLAVMLVLAAPQPPVESTIRFENVVEATGITFTMDNSVTPEKHQVETMIAGVAVLDYNNDGLLDIYFANGAKLPEMEKIDPRFWNRLYRNNGDMTFTDMTEKAGVKGKGYSMGIAVADYDNDGCQDMYVTGVNYNQLLHNNCDGTYSDLTEKAGLTGVDPKLGKTWAIGAGWFDYDNDGKLDLLVVNYVKWAFETEPPCMSNNVRAYCSPDSYEGLPDMLFHNNGDGTFSDVSAKSGIARFIGKGMGVAFADYDGDSYVDAFISNDTYRNFLLHNEGNGTFTETAILSGVAYNENGKSIAGMGCDFRDVDNDGRPDIFVTAMTGDTWPLFRNRGRDFQDITSIAGVASASTAFTAWGAGIFDFDNDGWKDLFATRASILDNAEEVDHLPSQLPNAVLRNLGGKRFDDVSPQAGPTFKVPRRHRGAAFGDLNNDGKIDVVVINQNARPEIFLNRSTNANHWLILDLHGKSSNRDGLGARVAVSARGLTQHNHATTSVGYATSSDRRVHFGLGAAAVAETVEITWPGKTRQLLHNVKTDQVLRIAEP